jgi:hypothetical protein
VRAVRSGGYRPAMPRLRALSEAECYTRLYGRDGEPTVTILGRTAPPLQRLGVSRDDLRRLFEERIDARESERLDEEEAA